MPNLRIMYRATEHAKSQQASTPSGERAEVMAYATKRMLDNDWYSVEIIDDSDGEIVYRGGKLDGPNDPVRREVRKTYREICSIRGGVTKSMQELHELKREAAPVDYDAHPEDIFMDVQRAKNIDKAIDSLAVAYHWLSWEMSDMREVHFEYFDQCQTCGRENGLCLCDECTASDILGKTS